MASSATLYGSSRRRVEADPVALLIQTLAAAGNIIGRCAYFAIESDYHRANLYAVLVGDSAKARKGTSWGRIRALTKIADPAWTEHHTKGGLSSGEGFIDAVRDEVKKFNAKDQTWEIVDPGVIDKRLFVIEPEFAGALSVMERSGNTLSPLIRQAWDGGNLATLTRNSPLRATAPHISITGHITVDEIRARLCRTDLANGFANRFLFMLVRRSNILPLGGNLTDSEILHLGEMLQTAVDNAKNIGLIEFDEEAAKAWIEIYHNLSVSKPGLLGAIVARGEAQVIRLAMIYAALDNSNAIRLPHLRAAVAAWDYAEASAAHIFGQSLGDPLADDILRTLRAQPQGLSRTDISGLLGHNKTSGRIGVALGLLQQQGLARCEMTKTVGRSSEVWSATRVD